MGIDDSLLWYLIIFEYLLAIVEWGPVRDTLVLTTQVGRYLLELIR